jgi:hypothetical protein
MIPRKALVEVVPLLRIYNTPAADAVLAALTDRLEKQTQEIEVNRLRREWRIQSRKRPPQNPIEEELVHLAQRRYKISFSPDGMWVSPQGGFRSAGPVLRKDFILHLVPAEKVVRREQHKIDSISGRIAVNANFAAMLESFARIFKGAGKIDYDQVLSGLASAFLAYEKGIVQPKFKTRLMVKLAMELVKTSKVCHDTKAKDRLLSFAGSMCRAAARELIALNENLGEQLRRIAARLKLETAIIARNLVRDANLQTFSESLLRSISNRRIMNSAKLTGELRLLAVQARDSLQIDDQTEVGIKRSAERLKLLTNLLAKVRRLIQEKYRFRETISRGKCLRDNLERIEEHNEEILRTLQQAANEAILIKFDVANKGKNPETMSPDEQQKFREAQWHFISENSGVFDQLAKLNAESDYQMVIDAHGDNVWLAHRFDVWKLGLKTAVRTS